jgi:methylphosphotriester-DNA--protein-cysteine methyltransferase
MTVPFKSIGIDYRQILGSKSIGDATIDTAFENYRRYYDRYRKSVGDTADTDTLSRY